MMSDDLDDLNQKINKKFIRNVIKPMKHANRFQDKPYQIPSSSEIFSSGVSPQEGPRMFDPSAYRIPETHFAPNGEMIPRQTNLLPVAPPPNYRQTPLDEGFVQSAPKSQSPERSSDERVVVATSPPLNCVNICGHVTNCPVCSQLYRPYVGVYITIIVILVIIILFLLKKILNF